MTTLHEIQQPPNQVPRYLSPSSLSAALDAMARYRERAKPVAGGTDLVVELDRGAHRGVDVLIDISRLGQLAAIESASEVVRLGALVTHNQVVGSEMCRQGLLPLAQACLEVGSPQLRNRATVAGNLVTASPANDTISALMALGASIEMASVDGTRTVPIAEFFTGFRTTALQPHELVTAITVPALRPDQRGVFVKAGLRRAQAISVVHLAMVLTFDGDRVTDASLALGSVAPTVILVPGLKAALAGRTLDAEARAEAVRLATESANPIDDLRATGHYRTAVVGTMVDRALGALADGRHQSQWPEGVPMLVARPSPAEAEGSSNDLDITADTPITATVNGATTTAGGAAGVTLLDWLRDEAGLPGVKEGCAEGECGACTVVVDGQAVMSCLTPAARAHGTSVVTVEGLADNGRLAPVQDAFIQTGGVQCGFCTPGFLMSCAVLLEEIPNPTLEQIRLGLAGNLCRCTGYKSIEAAVRIAAASEAESESGSDDDSGVGR